MTNLEKKRQMYMKRYFTYVNQTRECLRKPCPVKFEDKDYISFTNSWSLILTTEDCGEIEMFDETNSKYPNVGRLVSFDGLKKKIDFNKVISEAKSKGYRLRKSEVDHRFNYLMFYDDTYYKIGLIDISYGIINDGKEAMTYHPYGVEKPLTIQTELGFCVVMPVKFNDGEPGEDRVVIEVK